MGFPCPAQFIAQGADVGMQGAEFGVLGWPQEPCRQGAGEGSEQGYTAGHQHHGNGATGGGQSAPGSSSGKRDEYKVECATINSRLMELDAPT